MTPIDSSFPAGHGRFLASLVLASLLCPAGALAVDEDLFCSADAAVFGSHKVELSGPSRVNGPGRVGSNGYIKLSGSSTIEGDAVSASRVSLSGSAAVLGEIVEGAPEKTLASMGLDYSETMGASIGSVIGLFLYLRAA